MTPLQLHIKAVTLDLEGAREVYRARRDAGVCPVCEGPRDLPDTVHCRACLQAMAATRQAAYLAGVCTVCFEAPVAPAKRGRATRCSGCRQRAAGGGPLGAEP